MSNIGKINVFNLSKQKKLVNKNYFNFILTTEKSSGLLKQVVPDELINFLIERYSSVSSNTSSMENSSHRKIHAQRLIKIIKKNFKQSFNKKNVLEIGCGTGYLLSLIKKMGAYVQGLEPSRVKKIKKIDIKNEFFLKKKFNKKFDLILSNAVLEHEFNPNKFLKKTFKDLNYGGMQFLCVPDYTNLIKNGDPTLINHEHISYFTKPSLLFYLKKNKFKNISIFSDNFGNLYGIGFKRKTKSSKNKNKNKNQNKNFYFRTDKQYLQNFNNIIKDLNDWIDNRKNYNLGIYGATSSISTIFSKIKFEKKKIFIFDSDNEKQGKFVDTFPNFIMKPDKIKKKNIKKILILPYFYEKDIYKFLKNDIKFDSKNIKCISNFFRTRKKNEYKKI